MKPVVNCRWCGKEFEPRQTAQKYCPECRADPEVSKARARKRKREQRERKRLVLAGKIKVCEICGRAFFPTSNRQKWCPKHRKQGRREAKTRYMREYRRRKQEAAG